MLSSWTKTIRQTLKKSYLKKKHKGMGEIYDPHDFNSSENSQPTGV